MNKAELITKLQERGDLTRGQVESVVEGMLRVITDALVAGNEVNLVGFGCFLAKTRKARIGVNPQNPTVKIQIAAVTVPKFKAGKGLKDALKAKA